MKKLAVCSAVIPDCAKERLAAEGFDLLQLPPHPSLAPPVAHHADMITSVVDKTAFFDKIYYEEYRDTVETLCKWTGLQIRVVDDVMSDVYPKDVIFNALIDKSFAVCRKKSLSRALVEALEASGRSVIDVNQGYAACSCLSAGGAIITADRGIADAASRFADVLLISAGGVKLAPYDTGFIGGASGFDGERAYFVGDVLLHPDGERIVSHLAAHGVDAVSLGDGELQDVGGIKFIDIE